MEKFLKKYGIIILLYLVVAGGIILLNERIRLLNEFYQNTIEYTKWNYSKSFFYSNINTLFKLCSILWYFLIEY